MQIDQKSIHFVVSIDLIPSSSEDAKRWREPDVCGKWTGELRRKCVELDPARKSEASKTSELVNRGPHSALPRGCTPPHSWTDATMQTSSRHLGFIHALPIAASFEHCDRPLHRARKRRSTSCNSVLYGSSNSIDVSSLKRKCRPPPAGWAWQLRGASRSPPRPARQAPLEQALGHPSPEKHPSPMPAGLDRHQTAAHRSFWRRSGYSRRLDCSACLAGPRY